MIDPEATLLRDPSIDDLDTVIDIENEAFADPWPPMSLLMELKHDPRCRTVIAEVNGRVVGYLMAWCIADEMHIINLAVRNTERRTGLGRKLLGSCLDDARALGCTVATLEVRSSNIAAGAFYKKAGFLQCGLRKRYYSDNHEDALILALDIDPVI